MTTQVERRMVRSMPVAPGSSEHFASENSTVGLTKNDTPPDPKVYARTADNRQELNDQVRGYTSHTHHGPLHKPAGK
jgi:hypothetical protein